MFVTLELAALLVLTGAVLLSVPSWVLPSVAFATFALIPAQYLHAFAPNATLNPGLIVVVIWVARAPWRGESRRSPLLRVAVVMALWLALAVALSEIRSTSLAWSADFFLLVLVPAALLPRQPKAVSSLLTTWVWLSGVLSIYAIIETFALHSNPLFDGIYTTAEFPLFQVWDGWRATTSLGHPLMNGTFFAVGCLIALGRGLSRRPIRHREGLIALASGVAVLASASRGALLALAVGAPLLLIARRPIARSSESRHRGRSLALLLLMLPLLTVGGWHYLEKRSHSREGIASAEVRGQSLSEGWRLAEEHLPLGVGPGLADHLKRGSASVNEAGVENSWLQIAISQGVPGILLCGWLLMRAIIIARRDRPYLSAALITYAVAAGGYNLLESNRPALLLLGLLLGCAVTDLRADRVPAAVCAGAQEEAAAASLVKLPAHQDVEVADDWKTPESLRTLGGTSAHPTMR